MTRSAILVTILLLPGCGAPGAQAQEIIPTIPEAKSFMLGALEITVLRDGRLSIANDGSIFGLNTNPAAVARVLRDVKAATDKIQLDIDTLLIRVPSRVILIDAGYGRTGRGVERESLALIGVSPEEITDILITHAHRDHVGGLVNAQGQSAFPMAAIRMSVKE